MTRNDFILIAVLIIFSLTPLIIHSGENKKAVVKIDGVIVRELDLTTDETFILETSDGKNFVEVRGGNVRVVEANCPDKICVRRGAIKNVGEVIACVPHNLLIEVVKD